MNPMRRYLDIVNEAGGSSTPKLLYHGTLLENVKTIQKTGLEPRVGALTRAFHKNPSPLVYAVDDKNIRPIVSAITFQMLRKRVPKPNPPGYWMDRDLMAHGAILVLDGHLFQHRPFYAPGKEPPSGSLYGGTVTRDEDYPLGTEAGQFYSVEPVHVIRAMTGQRMMKWLYDHGNPSVAPDYYANGNNR